MRHMPDLSGRDLSRRLFLGGLAGASTLALGACQTGGAIGAARGDWRDGFANAPAGGFAPARMRLVEGRAPAGLEGALYRNGPAQLHHGDVDASHWFDGDGMMHRIAFSGGEVEHRAQFAQTNKRRQEMAAGKFLAPGFGTEADPDFAVQNPDDTNAANTSVIMINGRLMALWEAGSPYEMNPVTLETIGPVTWRDDMKGMPFLAHPKVEPDGRVWNLAVNGPRVGVYRISKDAVLEDFTLLDVGDAAYIHDWTMTERHLIILVQPWIQTRSLPPFIDSFDWRPQNGMRMLIVDKDDMSKRRWAQAPARAFYHTGSGWEDADGTIRFDAVFYEEPVLGANGGAGMISGVYEGNEIPPGELSMVEIPTSGDARITGTAQKGEFPQVDPRLRGKRRRLTVMPTGAAPGRPGETGVLLRDWESGRNDAHIFGPSHMVEEVLFVPKPGGSGERDSWLVGTALNIAAGANEVFVFDASNVSGGPVAVWRAEYTWPLGFHGTWTA